MTIFYVIINNNCNDEKDKTDILCYYRHGGDVCDHLV